jgi:5'-3' exonuclease
VGDAADGYPGIAGIGASGAARLLNQYGPLESFPPSVLGPDPELALLFKVLATLRTDAALFEGVEDLRWQGPAPAFAEWGERLGGRLMQRVDSAAARSTC